MFILGTEFMWSEKEKSVKGCVCALSFLLRVWADGRVGLCVCVRVRWRANKIVF